MTRALAGAGLRLWAVDSSPTLVAEFKARFPEVPVDCADAWASDYFERTFGAVIVIQRRHKDSCSKTPGNGRAVSLASKV